MKMKEVKQGENYLHTIFFRLKFSLLRDLMNIILYFFTDHAPLLPRYKYHCLLLDQLRNGIPIDRDFNKWTFNDSPLTVVGNVNEKQRHDLFKNSLEDGLSRGIKENMLPCYERKIRLI